MILEELQQIVPENGILKLSETDQSFEKLFLKYLKAGQQIYSDEEVRVLPFASKLNPHKTDWAFRAKSFVRFKDYLSQKGKGLNILILGSGDGWFASKILREQNHHFYCIDNNLQNLKQGAKLFANDNLYFIYADLFEIQFPRSSFDIIILNSSIQYFSDFRILMREFFYLLKPAGEIHIIDSKFYEEDEVSEARNKMFRYFELVGVSSMKDKYFFHTYKDLKNFNYAFLYDPRNFSNKIKNIFYGKDSYYPWIRITK